MSPVLSANQCAAETSKRVARSMRTSPVTPRSVVGIEPRKAVGYTSHPYASPLMRRSWRSDTLRWQRGGVSYGKRADD